MSSFGYNVLGFGSFANRSIRVTISSDVNNPDLDGGSYFGSAVWQGGTPKILEITSGTEVGSLVIPGSMGGTLTIENSGDIRGSSGSGGSANAGSGGAGGHAITSSGSFIYKGKSGSELSGGGGGGGGGGRAGPKSVTNQTYHREPPSGHAPLSPGGVFYANHMQFPGGQGGNLKWNDNNVGAPSYGFSDPFNSPDGWSYKRYGRVPDWSHLYYIYRYKTTQSTTNYQGGAGGAGGAGAGYGAASAQSGSSGSDGPGPAGTGGTGGAGGAFGASGSSGSTGGPPSGQGGGSGGSAGKAASFSSGSISIAENNGDINGDTS